MTIRPPAQCRDMTEVRTEIDRIDKTLVDAIAERFGYVERAWQLKLEAGQEANVPWYSTRKKSCATSSRADRAVDVTSRERTTRRCLRPRPSMSRPCC
jgi:chorismate mutase